MCSKRLIPRQRLTAPLEVRRSLLISGGIAIAAIGTTGALATTSERETIVQPATPDRDGFIGRAFEMRRLAVNKGDQPFGALVVRDGLIVGQSWSRVVLDGDPTAHAEMAAIRDAAKRLKQRNLRNAVLYSSSRPCPMCEAAAYWAGVGSMIHGREGIDGGRPTLCR